MLTDRRSVLTIIGLAILVVVAVGALVRTHQVDAKSQQSEQSFAPPTFSEPPSTIVQVIGDDVTEQGMNLRGVTPWTGTFASRLGISVIVSATVGSGYISEAPSSVGNGSFVAKARTTNPSSRLVVLFGGENDAKAPTLSTFVHVSQTVAAVKAAAPGAAIVIVGPVAGPDGDDAAITTLRSTLRRAAQANGAMWIDPIAKAWDVTVPVRPVGASTAAYRRAVQKEQATIASNLVPLLRGPVERAQRAESE